MTVSDCRGFGREKGRESPHRAVEDLVDYVPKVRIEVMIRDELADSVVDAIARTAHTGKPGDAKIFVYEISRAVRIKTLEEGEDAI